MNFPLAANKRSRKGSWRSVLTPEEAVEIKGLEAILENPSGVDRDECALRHRRIRNRANQRRRQRQLHGVRRPSRETLGERMTQHGHKLNSKPSPTYYSWLAMSSRCNNPNSSQYKYYGAIGVKVCERWRSFSAFLEDVGERPDKKYTLDRYPNRTGDYEPGNCRWATNREQSRNRRTTRRVIRDDGVEFNSIIEAAEATGSHRGQIQDVCAGRQKTHLGFKWSYADA